ncbi:hypothetical protein ON010_g7074 [Phytophthora cinnamomi]|nr:hypothetical protein ON010_g7074 [Phytophthora cinnamomi]
MKLSSPDVGSSTKKINGSPRISAASDNLFLSPPEMLRTRAPPINALDTFARPNHAWPCQHDAQPLRLRRRHQVVACLGRSSVPEPSASRRRGRPAPPTRPVAPLFLPAKQSSSDVLPAPDGPISTNSSPERAAPLKSSRMVFCCGPAGSLLTFVVDTSTFRHKCCHSSTQGIGSEGLTTSDSGSRVEHPSSTSISIGDSIRTNTSGEGGGEDEDDRFDILDTRTLGYLRPWPEEHKW